MLAWVVALALAGFLTDATQLMSTDLRPVVLALLLLVVSPMALWSGYRLLSESRAGFLFAFGLVLSATSFWSSVPLRSLLTGVAGAIAALLVDVASWAQARRQAVLTAIHSVLVGFLATSLVFWVVAPGQATLGGRLRGVFDNPNTLGTLAALTGVSLIAQEGRTRKILGLLVLSLIVPTASRSSALAAGVGLSLVVAVALTRVGLHRWARLFKLGSLIVFGVTTIVLLTADPGTVVTFGELTIDGDSDQLLRVNNSRAERWSLGLAALAERPWTGSGLGSLPLIGNSYIRILAESGFAVGALLALLLVGFFRERHLSAYPIRPGVVAAGLTSAAFEDWLAAPSAPIFIAFVLLSVVDDRMPVVPERVVSNRRPAPQSQPELRRNYSIV